jgi:hypothetical protein
MRSGVNKTDTRNDGKTGEEKGEGHIEHRTAPRKVGEKWSKTRRWNVKEDTRALFVRSFVSRES